MEFLDSFVLPQSSEHIELLHYMLILILFLFLPFTSVLFGGAIFSLRYKRKADRTGNKHSLNFAKDIMEIVTINKSTGLILGVVPILTALLIYAQLLNGSIVTNLNFIALSAVFMVLALLFIYYYRYTLSSIGVLGVLFLFVALWLFITGMSIPVLYSEWNTDSIISGLFSFKVVFRFFYYFCASFALTGGMLLFSFLEVSGKKYSDEEYKNYIKTRAIKITFAPAIILPFLMFINLILFPGESLSGSVFVFIVISIALLFLSYHFLYLLTKEVKGTIAALLFFTLIFSVAANIISEQKVMSNSTKIQSAILASNFDEYITELRGEDILIEINGEEIYKYSCSACHKFDEKLVGPPHNKVLPKYVGKEAQLIAFIRNPSKVDPEYPPMPNPGLKPNEAEAVAKYLLSTFETLQ